MSENTPNTTADEFDLEAFDNLAVSDPDIEYQQQDDEGCEGGACKI